MMPEDDFRYLAPVNDFIPRGETVEFLEANIRHHQEILHTCATPGWKAFRSILNTRRDTHISALVSVQGAMEIEAIFGLRQGLNIINQLLDLEVDTNRAMEHDTKMLNDIRAREAK